MRIWLLGQDRLTASICATKYQGQKTETKKMKAAVVRARVTHDIKEKIAALAANEGSTESHVVRRMIESELSRNEQHQMTEEIPKAEGLIRKQITLNVPTFIADLAKERAIRKGMSLSRWIACLIQSHVYQPPVLTTTELKILNESNRQIRAMGVNINQIARAFNNMDVDIRKLKDFYLVESLIKKNLDVIDKLMRAANRSWGVGHGTD